MVGARRSYIDRLIGRRHPAEADGRRDTLRTDYRFDDLTAKVTVRPGFRHRISVSFYDGGDALDVRLPFELIFDPRALARAIRQNRWSPADLSVDVDHAWGNRLASARYQYLASPRLFTTATVYHSSYHAEERTLLRPTEGTAIRADYTVRLADAGVRGDAELVLSPTVRGRMGVQAAARRFDSSLETETTQAATTLRSSTLALDGYEAAAYAQAHLRLSPRMDVQGGLRAVAIAPGGYAYLIPNVSVQARPGPKGLVVRLGAGTSVQPMHRLRDQTSLLYDLVAERWIPASERVRPSVGQQVAAGLEWRPVGLSLSAEAYLRRATGVLVADPRQAKDVLVGAGIDLSALLGQYTRAEARGAGLEVVLQGPVGRWDVYAAYSLERSLRRAAGSDRFVPSRYDIPQRLKFVLARPLGPLRATLSGEVRDGEPEAVPEAIYRSGDGLEGPEVYLARPDAFNGRLPPYGRLDAAVMLPFALLDARWRLTVQAYNLLTYRNITGRTYTPGAGGLTVQERRGLPLLPLIELEMQL